MNDDLKIYRIFDARLDNFYRIIKFQDEEIKNIFTLIDLQDATLGTLKVHIKLHEEYINNLQKSVKSYVSDQISENIISSCEEKNCQICNDDYESDDEYRKQDEESKNIMNKEEE